MADNIHDWHHYGDWPPDSDYCFFYAEADGVLHRLLALLGNPASPSDVNPFGSSGGIPNWKILAAYYDLDDELGEEDEINYEDGWDGCGPPNPFNLISSFFGTNPGYYRVDPKRLIIQPGFYAGVEFQANWGKLGITETNRITNDISNQFSESGKRDGFGLRFGYRFAPWNSGLFIDPVLQLAIYDQTIRKVFPSTSYLGLATLWSMSAIINLGYNVQPNVSIYALGGVALRTAKYEINFGGQATSDTKTAPGLVIGAGVEYKPYFLLQSKLPMTVFAEYQHIEYQDVKLDAPEASPFFDYKFKSRDDVFKVGLNIQLSGIGEKF